MKINNLNQSFGAKIITNNTFRKAAAEIRQRNQSGDFIHTTQFINALEAIKETDEFDTFEITSRPLEKTAKEGGAFVQPFEIKIDGKPYECKELRLFSMWGYKSQEGIEAVYGILNFAKEFFDTDFNKPVAKNQEKLQEIDSKIQEHKRQLKALEKASSKAYEDTIEEYQMKLNKLYY